MIALALGLTACGGSSGGGSASDGGSEGGEIVVGSLLDTTGPLNIYGKEMTNATQMAIDDINANGGVLGEKLKLDAFDTQSDDTKYTQYANQLALQDHPAVVMGGITSASREAIRPIFDRNKILYFYNEQYEGGVCDANTFNTGVVPSQQLAALIPWAIENVGPKLYVVAAEYNYGEISADWVKKYAEENGGTVVGTEFVPLESSDFSSVISHLQTTKPDAVVSLLVGGEHIPFYRTFNATGLNSEMKIVSPTFGLGNEQVVLPANESKEITVAYPYIESLENPVNKKFVQEYKKRFGANAYVTDSAVTVWNGWHLWAEAVEKAGSTDREAVIDALQEGEGISFDSPSGKVTMDPGSHHVTQDISIAKTNDKHGFTVISTKEDVPPSYEDEVCDLVKDPSTNQQFTP
ncbi:MAG TPA: ABC transporter substrate-binding protein [Solirubrobacterales bacterium]|nr:ABC transporter substrate-binding protein [Solirubrobacterales bacterium]